MTDSGLLCEDERVTFSCEVWRFPEPYNVFVIQAEVNHHCILVFARDFCNLGRDTGGIGEILHRMGGPLIWGVKADLGENLVEPPPSSVLAQTPHFVIGHNINGLIQLGWDPESSLITVPISIWSGARVHIVNVTARR